MLVFYPNDGDYIKDSANKPIVFLGGSIDNNKAINWQDKIVESLSDKNVILLNPRRKDWDPNWAQDPTKGTPFHSQVKWEMTGQRAADIIVYYFAPGSVSPITLLELGMFAHRQSDVVIYCPKDFWRYGNVKYVADDNLNVLFEDEQAFIEYLRESVS